MHTSTTKLGAAIKSARKSRKLTQLEPSEELGITPRYLQAIENEKKTPSYFCTSFLIWISLLTAYSLPIKVFPLQKLNSFCISSTTNAIRGKYRFSFLLQKPWQRQERRVFSHALLSHEKKCFPLDNIAQLQGLYCLFLYSMSILDKPI